MDFSFLTMGGKGLKGLIATLLAQLITQIPNLAQGIPLGDWGEMTVRGAVVAVLVMIANFIKHKLVPDSTVVKKVL